MKRFFAFLFLIATAILIMIVIFHMPNSPKSPGTLCPIEHNDLKDCK